MRFFEFFLSFTEFFVSFFEFFVLFLEFFVSFTEIFVSFTEFFASFLSVFLFFVYFFCFFGVSFEDPLYPLCYSVTCQVAGVVSGGRKNDGTAGMRGKKPGRVAIGIWQLPWRAL